MSLFRIDSSILGDYSSSHELADVVEKHWLAEHAGATVVRRDLATDLIPVDYWPAAVSAGQTPEDQWSDTQKAAKALAVKLYEELAAAETIIVSTGLYNWGINSLLKNWVDLVLTGAPFGVEFLKGKDVALVVTRGGYYGEDGPKAGWDHGTPWIERVLAEVWGANVTLVARDFTLVGVNPALDEFKEQGAALREAGLAAAETTGKEFAASYASRKSA